ncbi:MAG: hypothetical protein ACYC2H_08415 [Thermoplasmatota archaeon]
MTPSVSSYTWYQAVVLKAANKPQSAAVGYVVIGLGVLMALAGVISEWPPSQENNASLLLWVAWGAFLALLGALLLVQKGAGDLLREARDDL